MTNFYHICHTDGLPAEELYHTRTRTTRPPAASSRVTAATAATRDSFGRRAQLQEENVYGEGKVAGWRRDVALCACRHHNIVLEG